MLIFSILYCSMYIFLCSIYNFVSYVFIVHLYSQYIYNTLQSCIWLKVVVLFRINKPSSNCFQILPYLRSHVQSFQTKWAPQIERDKYGNMLTSKKYLEKYFTENCYSTDRYNKSSSNCFHILLYLRSHVQSFQTK